MAEYVPTQVNKVKNKQLNLGQTFIYAAICMLAAQVSILDMIAPFGIAAYCCLQLRHQKSWIISMGTCIGMLVLNTPEKIWYIGLISTVFIASISIQTPRRTISRMQAMCIAGVLTGVMTATQSILASQLMIYTIAYVCATIVVTVSSVYVFDIVFEGLKTVKSGRKTTFIEKTAMLIIIGICIAGCQTLSIGMFPLKESVYVFVVMVIAYRSGGNQSAVSGLSIGVIILLLSSIKIEYVLAICIGGLLAGNINQHRIGFLLSFLGITGAILFITTPMLSAIGVLGPIFVCGGFIILIPQTTYRLIDALLNTEEVKPGTSRDYAIKIRKVMVDRLNDFSEAHRQLANHFSDLIMNKETSTVSEATEIAACMTETACSGCSRFDYCWNKQSDKLISAIIEISKILDQYGMINQQHMPKAFLSVCQYPEEMCDWINDAYLQYKIEEEWSETVQNYRRLTVKQLIGISDAAAQLAKKIRKEFKILPEWEDHIKRELQKKKIKAKQVTVVKQEDNCKVIMILEESIIEQVNEKSAQIEEVVSHSIDSPMKIKKINIYPKGTCEVELKSSTMFDVVCAVIREPKTVLGECGDNYSNTEINGNKYLMCISDGMGSGLQAAQESETVVSLIEDFMQAGYDIDLTIDTINSILSVRREQESFATADICEIDLQTGFASIIKVGAVPTFIKRRKGVEMINMTNLPIGILEYVDMEKVDVKLNIDDMIIMMSDGIRDVIGGEGANHDQALIELIDCIETLNPNMVSKIIMEKAIADTSEEHQDDMTVMVARMMKS